ncbi:MAG: hypothetical protein GF330_14610 [Candidatus Eisenbacteria bacterium]|nr:hypothetical protein [Candidatus Eisenbacteria bacterium]
MDALTSRPAARVLAVACRWGSLIALIALLPSGCGGDGEKEPAARAPAPVGTTLYLSQAQFLEEEGSQRGIPTVPGAARLVIYTLGETRWIAEVLEDPASNVFHKAAWFHPPEGDPGILTIGATQAYLKLWRRGPEGWDAETLWNPIFGGEWNRLRDFEVADVRGDATREIVVATHDQGVVAVVSFADGRWQAEELARGDSTFVHEIEVGDVDGDGTVEIFATPSRPNMLDGRLQPGRIDMFAHDGTQWTRRTVEALETRHAKEILCTRLSGDAHPVLFASLEGEKLGGGSGGDNTRIRVYRFDGKEIRHQDIASLPGRLCRFLVCGDTDGDGVREVIAATMSDGIWKLTPSGDDASWEQELIATGTSGFEHATYLFDADGDGKEEIYVASDKQHELRCYWFTDGEYRMQVLGPLKDNVITFNVTAHRPPRQAPTTG